MKKIDIVWINERIEKRYGSQRRFAPRLRGRNGKPMEQSVLNKMLTGVREMLLSEACQIADLLGVSLSELARRMGN